MKPRPRREYKEGQHKQNVEIKRKKVKDLVNENLHEFAQRRAEQMKKPLVVAQWVLDIIQKQKDNICLFCDKQLEMYTSSKGNIYLANVDHSPHRKVYKCCNTWGEYNGIK